MNRIATKFVSWNVPELERLKESKVYKLRLMLNNGGKLDRKQKNWLTEKSIPTHISNVVCHCKVGNLISLTF